MKNTLEIVWTKPAQNHLKEIHDYISKESDKAAIKVINDLVIAVENIAKYPEKHKIDQYKKDNDGTYRAFEKHHFRVSYRNENEIIRILRVRHTKMNPKQH
ncbi:type II toxin-antitoxin system RelE/ParE family toxin [Pedobacter endophyticus]|uniref:Type II toxin-antitoxin system RelE/ParE family toxin n=1 Tax=Pedobacter endophyticus TaxID=2789740 RepID=A0A7S9PZ66_9SPHI|nr:type II toxin-antitoxin system RelE/ParE family toxin [Pedobacter endophyticus]QPH39620.1 type II toxin-antitoxin system RelE/ParE family toxin [Pedobacter endophyticus]